MRKAYLIAATLALVAVARPPAGLAASASVPPPTDLALARDMLAGLVGIDTTHANGSTAAAQAIEGWLATSTSCPSARKAQPSATSGV